MLNLLRHIINNYCGAWSNSEYFGRVVGYFLILFTLIVLGFIGLSTWAGVIFARSSQR